VLSHWALQIANNSIIWYCFVVKEVLDNNYIEEIATLGDLVKLGYFRTVEEAEAYFAAQEQADAQEPEVQ